ncbi:MAG: T9SS type A sorting domain-containing protein [Saprospiraceae bacterium]
MKKQILTAFFISFSMLLFAQEKPIPTEFHPCGTAPVKSEWLKNYQKNPSAFAEYSRNQTTLYPAMTLHIVGSDDGTGYVSYIDLLDGFCGLNMDMEQADIHFFIHGDMHFIDSSGWYNHSTVLEGADMMFANNVDSTLNCYIVGNPAGNAGYNLPYAGIAMSKGSAGNINSNTWAHEVGHNFSIQHPFLGWEGDTYNYNTPTPTTVTYDYTYFKDTLIIDTTIIDTAFVELVDGSNCTFAADGFCDTPPDYLSTGSNCNAQGLSLTLQKDPNGVDFRSDVTNIMTYGNDACGSNFTPEQIAAMRAYLQTVRSPYLGVDSNPIIAEISNAPNQVSPAASGVEQFDFVELEWNTVTNATHYAVQVSRFPSFLLLEYNAITTDTTALITSLQNNRSYYWRVKAFNQGYTCAPTSPTVSFQTENLVRTENIESVERFGIYPTIIENGQNLTVEITTRKRFETQLRIFNIAGQQMLNQPFNVNIGKNQEIITLPNLAGGTYIVQIQTEEGMINEKIVVY